MSILDYLDIIDAFNVLEFELNKLTGQGDERQDELYEDCIRRLKDVKECVVCGAMIDV